MGCAAIDGVSPYLNLLFVQHSIHICLQHTLVGEGCFCVDLYRDCEVALMFFWGMEGSDGENDVLIGHQQDGCNTCCFSAIMDRELVYENNVFIVCLGILCFVKYFKKRHFIKDTFDQTKARYVAQISGKNFLWIFGKA